MHTPGGVTDAYPFGALWAPVEPCAIPRAVPTWLLTPLLVHWPPPRGVHFQCKQINIKPLVVRSLGGVSIGFASKMHTPRG